MNLRMLPDRRIEKPSEHQMRLQRRAFRQHQRQETTGVPRGGKRSPKTILSKTEDVVSESFYQEAGDFLGQHLAARSHFVTAKAHPKVLALHALLGEIKKQMAGLPLKRRLKFFRSSVAIVAEVLAAMHREAPAHRAVPGASADHRRISPPIHGDRSTRPSRALHVHRSSAVSIDREPAGDPTDADRYLSEHQYPNR